MYERKWISKEEAKKNWPDKQDQPEPSKPEDLIYCRKCTNQKEEGENHCAYCDKYL
jgi:hypothetical protein